jgi:hypothetical protein
MFANSIKTNGRDPVQLMSQIYPPNRANRRGIQSQKVKKFKILETKY